MQGSQHCVSKVWKLRLTYALLQVIGLPRHRKNQQGGGAFVVFLWGNFCKIKSKFLNSRVFAGGFVMGCAKKSWF